MNAYESSYSTHEAVATISPSSSAAKNDWGSARRKRSASSRPGFQPSASAHETAVSAARLTSISLGGEPTRTPKGPCTDSKNGAQDEHPPVRDEMRQVVRQALDVFARLLLEAVHSEDLGDQHVVGFTDGLSGHVRRPHKPPIRDRVQRPADDVAIVRHQTLKVLGQLRRTQLKPHDEGRRRTHPRSVMDNRNVKVKVPGRADKPPMIVKSLLSISFLALALAVPRRHRRLSGATKVTAGPQIGAASPPPSPPARPASDSPDQPPRRRPLGRSAYPGEVHSHR